MSSSLSAKTVLFVLGTIALGAMAYFSKSTLEHSSDAPPAGLYVVLAPTVGSSSPYDLISFNHAQRNRDTAGTAAMMEDGRIFPVEAGTEIYGGELGRLGVFMGRVLSGRLIGKTIYVSRAYVDPKKPPG